MYGVSTWRNPCLCPKNGGLKEGEEERFVFFSPYCKFHIHDNSRVCVYSLM